MTHRIRPFTIDGIEIGLDNSPYCIAEVGINHNGDLATAKRMIEVAKSAGANAVKFQTFKAEEFCGDKKQKFTYTSQGKIITESMLEMFQRYQFPDEYWQDIKSHCQLLDITFFSTPQNFTDLELLMKIGVPVIKVGSDDFTNLPLLSEYGETKLPLILSCGMSNLAEVDQALEAAGWFEGNQVAVLLCTSQYPTPPEDVNIRKLTTLQQAFPGLVIGFSDHTQGSLAAALAVSRGARIFEKHFTLDRGMPGPDHWFSEDPAGLTEWIQAIRTADVLLGSSLLRPTKAEEQMRLIARRSIVALKNISLGEVLNADNLGLRRPGDGLPPSMYQMLIGLKSARVIQQGERIAFGDAVKC